PVDNISTFIIVFSHFNGQNTIAQSKTGGREKLARLNAAPKGLETCAHTDVGTICQRVVAVAVFTRQVQITITRFDGDRTDDGPASTHVGFLIAIDTAGEGIRRVVVLTEQA